MNLVSIEWLKENMSNPQLVLLDATLPPVGKKWEDIADTGHIPGSLRFDIDDFSQHDSNLPHTLLPPDLFQDKVRALGIDNESAIVVYDCIGIYSAARVVEFQINGTRQRLRPQRRASGVGRCRWLCQCNMQLADTHRPLYRSSAETPCGGRRRNIRRIGQTPDSRRRRTQYRAISW